MGTPSNMIQKNLPEMPLHFGRPNGQVFEEPTQCKPILQRLDRLAGLHHSPQFRLSEGTGRFCFWGLSLILLSSHVLMTASRALLVSLLLATSVAFNGPFTMLERCTTERTWSGLSNRRSSCLKRLRGLQNG